MHTLILICSAILAGLVLILGFWVSIQRSRTKIIGHNVQADPTSGLAKAQRAHGNSTEYAGALIGLFLVTGFVYADRDLGLTVTGLVVAITLARILHALGCLTCKTLDRPHPLKAIGAVVTYFGGLALAAMAVFKLF